MRIQKVLWLYATLIILTSLTFPVDFVALKYTLSGRVYFGDSLLKNVTIQLYSPPGKSYEKNIFIDETGKYSAEVEVVGACPSGLGKKNNESYDVAFLRATKRINNDTLIFFYQGNVFITKGFVNETIAKYLNDKKLNVYLPDSIYPCDVKFK